jgi:hypothetical protein
MGSVAHIHPLHILIASFAGLINRRQAGAIRVKRPKPLKNMILRRAEGPGTSRERPRMNLQILIGDDDAA